jgi:hypothetical protein
LAKAAEEFIVGWARELPPRAQLRILVHVPETELQAGDAAALGEAIGRHFTARADRVRGDLHELFQIGRVSLAIGLCVLGACILGARLLDGVLGGGPFARFFTEGLFILGWVANWRPIEIFFYDWWPLAQRRALFLRLAQAPVELRPFPAI